MPPSHTPRLRRLRIALEGVPVVGSLAVRLGRRALSARAQAAIRWADPPVIADPSRSIRAVDPAPPRTYQRYDVELFEALNLEYADHPLSKTPPRYDEASMLDRARRRLLAVHRAIDLRGKRVLEFGCGAGFEIWTVSHTFDSEGWGVDIVERRAWAALADDRTHFVEGDIGQTHPFEPDFFDRVISFTVFEHVTHPYAALAELYRVMKPGGRAWIKANLYRGPMASHRYREVTFPFPHLLFTDDVFREFYRRRGTAELNPAWVNRLSWSDYEAYFARIGFRIRSLRFTETPLDEDLYRRFEDVLGRFPRTDLTRDFFEVILDKPAGRQLPSIPRLR
jgi:ubiquinone/menaquinone biosynthesis C-methylase UbiE